MKHLLSVTLLTVFFIAGMEMGVPAFHAHAGEPSFHPADVNMDWRMVMGEAIPYLSGWQSGSNPMAYAIRAAYLWQNGEYYHYEDTALPPLCWVLGASPVEGEVEGECAFTPAICYSKGENKCVPEVCYTFEDCSTGATVFSREWKAYDATYSEVVDDTLYACFGPGIHVVDLQLNTDCGSFIASTEVTVADYVAPEAYFEVDPNPAVAMLSTLFKNLSTPGDCFFTSSSWDFGDGTPVEFVDGLWDNKHVYEKPGTYLACLTVECLDECKGFVSAAVADKEAIYCVEITVLGVEGEGEPVEGELPEGEGTPSPWQNPRNPMDVNDDGSVTPTDVLIIINDLNINGPRELPNPPVTPPPPYLDVNGDGSVSSVDALIIINYLNETP